MCFSENEIYSINDIMLEFDLEENNPLVYGIYLSRNPELNQDEKDTIKAYMNKLIKKVNKMNERNIQYMTQHLQKEN